MVSCDDAESYNHCVVLNFVDQILFFDTIKKQT